jgi:Fe2+ transport system protein FeoA
VKEKPHSTKRGVELHCVNPLACPLSQVKEGARVRIKRLSAPPEVNHRLREMGLGEENQVRLLAQSASIICQVCNMRVGLSADLAEKIMVEPVLVHSKTAKAA